MGISRFISGRRSFLPWRCGVALVFRVDGYGYVAQQGFRSGRGYREIAVRLPGQGVN